MAALHPDMSITEVLELKPQAKAVLFDYGVFTENNAIQSMETVRVVCATHGLTDELCQSLFKELAEL